MASEERPLLARDNSEDDSFRRAEEEDALLTGQPIIKTTDSGRKWTEIGLFVWALVATIVVVVLAVILQHEREAKHVHKPHHGRPKGKRNMIFMVSSGMGPASLEMTRTWRQYTDGLPYDDVLVLDEHLIGSHRTRSSSSIVTDSAAGATAFSCGSKTTNEFLSVLPDLTPCGTVLEAAKKAGYITGLVVTTRVTDATPAAFGAHASSRWYQESIAEQLIGHHPLGQTVDLLMGGGRCYFLPNTTEGSCRHDDKDIIHMASENGYSYIDNRRDFDRLDPKRDITLPFLALLANKDIPFEIDRRHIPDEYPSQYEMAKFALDTLSTATTDSEKGFFIMIEGSRIEHAARLSDPAAQVHEILLHDKTFAAALDFAQNSNDETVVISTSDKATGGLAAARRSGPKYPENSWLPGVLANANNSVSHTHDLWREYLSKADSSVTREEQTNYLRKILSKNLGVTDPTTSEMSQLLPDHNTPVTTPPVFVFAGMISRRAQLTWYTNGHLSTDVNIYASKSEHVRTLIGNHENVEISNFMVDYLGLDLAAVTKELIDKKTRTHPEGLVDGEVSISDWMGPGMIEKGDGMADRYDDLDQWIYS